MAYCLREFSFGRDIVIIKDTLGRSRRVWHDKPKPARQKGEGQDEARGANVSKRSQSDIRDRGGERGG